MMASREAVLFRFKVNRRRKSLTARNIQHRFETVIRRISSAEPRDDERINPRAFCFGQFGAP